MLKLSVCLSVPCLHLEGKRKSLRILNLVGRVPGTPAPRGPISRSRGQRSRSRRLIALLAKNPHNFAACCPINVIFGMWRKDPHSGRPLNGRTLLLFLGMMCCSLARPRCMWQPDTAMPEWSAYCSALAANLTLRTRYQRVCRIFLLFKG